MNYCVDYNKRTIALSERAVDNSVIFGDFRIAKASLRLSLLDEVELIRHDLSRVRAIKERELQQEVVTTSTPIHIEEAVPYSIASPEELDCIVEGKG